MVSSHIPFSRHQHDYHFYIISIFYKNKYAFPCHILILGCAKNQYPIGISRGCQREFSCDKLASSDKCDNTYIQAMSPGCYIPLNKYWQNQKVKRHCKRACKNCEGIFQFSIYFLCLYSSKLFILNMYSCYHTYSKFS